MNGTISICLYLLKTIVWTIFNFLNIALRWRAGLDAIERYRHIAPLEQRPTTYSCARRNQYGTNDTESEGLLRVFVMEVI